MITSAALILIVVAATLLLWKRFMPAARRPAWLPKELQDGKEYSRERLFSAKVNDFEVAAKPDRVYRLADGRLCVIEFKTRTDTRLVHQGDIWQISAGAAALSRVGAVADHGWVIVEDRNTRQRQAHQVGILKGQALAEVMQRYTDVETGAVTPSRTRASRKCTKCGHRAACQP